MGHTRPYTTQEDEFIKENYLRMTSRQIAEVLDRSPKGIANRAQILCLQKLRHWTSEEDQVLWESEDLLLKDVAEKLGRSVTETSSRWRKISNGKSWPARFGYKPTKQGYTIAGFERKNGASQKITEHRQIVESLIGRELLPEELVHHINTIKTDNRPENLYLCKDRSQHMHVHRTLEKLLPSLMADGIIRFNHNTGEYERCTS